MGGDSTGTQAPADQSGWLLWRGRQDVLWERRAGLSIGLLMVAIFVSPS